MFVRLLSSCVVLFGVSWLFGCFPLFLSVSHRHRRLLITYGIGILLGTAFITIIPQGVENIYHTQQLYVEAQTATAYATPSILDWEYWTQKQTQTGDEPETYNTQRRRRLLLQTDEIHLHDKHLKDVLAGIDLVNIQATRESAGNTSVFVLPVHAGAAVPGWLAAVPAAAIVGVPSVLDHQQHPCSFVSEPLGSSSMGAALALGFVIMLLIDRCTSTNQQQQCEYQPLSQSDVSKSTEMESPNQTDDDSDLEINQRSNVIHLITIDPTQSTAHSHPLSLPSAASASSASSGSASSPGADEKERERRRREREKEQERAQGYQPYEAKPSSSPRLSIPGGLPGGAASSISNAASSLCSLFFMSPFGWNALLGILVYALVDGISLGLFCLAFPSLVDMWLLLQSVSRLSPLAFGVVSFLIYQGRSSGEIKLHLAIFSACHPFAAFLTYAAVVTTSQHSTVQQLLFTHAIEWLSAEGLALLFAAGTFLFTVALYIMPIMNKQDPTLNNSPGYRTSANNTQPPLAGKATKLREVAANPAEMEGLLLRRETSHGHPHYHPHPHHQYNYHPISAHHTQLSDLHIDDSALLAEPLEWNFVACLVAGALSPLILHSYT